MDNYTQTKRVQTIGCIWVAFAVAVFIATIIVGGNFRTEVTFTSPGVSDVSNPIPFEEKLRANHWLFALIKGSQPDFQSFVDKYALEGKRITQLTIITKHNWLNYLIMGVTIGIYCPMKVIVKGTLEKISEVP